MDGKHKIPSKTHTFVFYQLQTIMKHLRLIVLSVSVLLLSATAYKAYGVPAKRTPVVVTQDDGTKITVINYGDEFYHYATTTDGYTLAYDDAGYYCYAMQSNDGTLRSSGVKANDPARRGAQEKAALSALPKGLQNYSAKAQSDFARMDVGAQRAQAAENRMQQASPSMIGTTAVEEVKGLVILVNFQDKKMSHSASEIDALLNQEGYNAGGAFGSVHEYYRDNSNGDFLVNFKVAGPYTISREMSYYGGNDGAGQDLRPRDMVKEAFDAAAADGSINLSEYATNGRIENLMIIYAGNGEADSGIRNAIWPHEWSLQSPYSKNGVTIQTYACSAELRGNGKITGIGVICHEYAHVLGIPDFYDTDYTTGGQAFGMDVFSLMDQGSYAYDGMRPPSLTAFERYMSGWLQPIEITEAGTYTLEPVYGDNAYMMKTSVNNEMFFFENRNGKSFKWDNFLDGGDSYTYTSGSGKGLFVTHIDRSSKTYGGYPSAMRWEYNMINSYAAHQCFRIIMASPVSRGSNGTLSGIGKIFFPGTSNVTAFTEDSTPKFADWNGVSPEFQFTKIAMDGDNVILTVGIPGDEEDPDPEEPIDPGYPEGGLPGLNLAASYAVGQPFELAVRNIEPTSIISIEWKVNGSKVSTTRQTLTTAGEYKIEATVTRTNDTKEYFMRYIEVK
jgi:M6 family metalloprotease-like protein